jgi:hypothetical protein
MKTKPQSRTQPGKSASEKIDLYQQHKADYVASKQPVLLHIAPARYLTIRGQGKPGGELFQAHIGALYAVAYTIKMTRKFAGHQDYGICKLEGQWFFDGDPEKTPPEQFRWRLLIRTPEFSQPADLKQAVAALRKKGKAPEASPVKLETIREGRCVQMLHVGPYDQECGTLSVMKAFVESQGLQLACPRHEIYLTDPRRVPPERLKTILRLPVARA